MQTSDIVHTVRCAYRKMKDAKKLGASIKLRKKEKFLNVGGYTRILTCSSIGMNRNTDLKNIVFKNKHGKL